MFIALTGSPGTGKTRLAQQLQKKHVTVISFQDFALKHHCDEGYDKEKDTRIIDIDKVNQALNKVDYPDEPIVIEGHLSHLLNPIKKVIILRCHPKILYKRLQQKDWKQQKIKENMEAEMLDIILCETMDRYPPEDVFEIDTSYHTPTQLSSTIINLIKNQFIVNPEMKPGQIDWSENLMDSSWMEENNGS